MPLSFQPRSHSSYDPTSDVSIPRPRILPTTLASGEGGTEYHYSFFRGEDRIGGLGFDGPDVVVETDGYREWVFTFDLTREQTSSPCSDLKQISAARTRISRSCEVSHRVWSWHMPGKWTTRTIFAISP